MENDDERTNRGYEGKRDPKFKKLNKKVDFQDMLSLTKNEINYDLDLMLCSSNDPIQFQNSDVERNEPDTLTEEQMIQYTDKSAKSLITRVNTLNKLITRASFKTKKAILTKESLVQSALSCLIKGDGNTKSINVFETTPDELATKKLKEIESEMNEYYKHQTKQLTTQQEVLKQSLKELTDSLNNKESKIENLKQIILEKDKVIETLNENKIAIEENYKCLVQEYNSVINNNMSNSEHNENEENNNINIETKKENEKEQLIKKIKPKKSFKIKHINNNIKSLLLNKKFFSFIKNTFKDEDRLKAYLKDEVKFKIKKHCMNQTENIITLEELEINKIGVLREDCWIKDIQDDIYHVQGIFISLTEVEFYVECCKEVMFNSIPKENEAILTERTESNVSNIGNKSNLNEDVVMQRTINNVINDIIDSITNKNKGENVNNTLITEKHANNRNIEEINEETKREIVKIRMNNIKQIIKQSI